MPTKKILFLLLLVLAAITTTPAVQAEEDCFSNCQDAYASCLSGCTVNHDWGYCSDLCGPSYTYCINCICGFFPSAC